MSEASQLIPILGPWLMGTAFSSVFFGLVLNQWTQYMRAHAATDHIATHALVAGLMLICVVDWSVTVYVDWELLVREEGHTPKGQITLLFMPVLAGALGETFFGHRCWRLWGKRMLLLAPIALLVLGPFATGITAIAFDFIVHDDARTDPNIMKDLNNEVHTLEAWTWLSAAVDVLLCAGICAQLIKKRTTDGIDTQVENVLDKLMRLSMTTAAGTALIAGANAIALHTSSETNAGIAFFLCQPYTYALSTIFTLNSRSTLSLPGPRGVGVGGATSTAPLNRTTGQLAPPSENEDSIKGKRSSVTDGESVAMSSLRQTPEVPNLPKE